jgi:hypothetical protein
MPRLRPARTVLPLVFLVEERPCADTLALKRVQVVRGPAALLHGAAAVVSLSVRLIFGVMSWTACVVTRTCATLRSRASGSRGLRRVRYSTGVNLNWMASRDEPTTSRFRATRILPQRAPRFPTGEQGPYGTLPNMCKMERG